MFRHWRLIWRLFPYMRPYRLLATVLVLLTLLSALFALVAPWPLAVLIDNVLGDKEFPGVLRFLRDGTATTQILVAVLVGFGFVLVSNSLTVVTRAVDTRLELGMVLDFRSDLFAHIQRLSFQFHDRKAAGRFIYQVNYVAHEAGSIPTTMLPLAQSALTLVGMFVVTYRLQPSLALAALVVVPLVYYATTFYGKHIEPRLFTVRELEGESMNIVHEKLSIIRVVVSFCREQYEHARFRAQAKQGVDARVRVTILQTLFSLGVALITAAGTTLVLYIGAHAVLRGDLTIGELTVVLAYVAAVYQPLEQISSTLAGLQQQLIMMDMVFQVLDSEPDVAEGPDAVELTGAEGRIELRHVSFHYQSRERTLDDISLTVEPGEFVAVVGPTGAGKSTLVSLLPRFFDPQQGEVLIDGHDVRDLTLSSLREAISIVMQEPVLFAGTIADNIRYGRLDATDDEVVVAAKAANAHEFIEKLPGKYRTTVGERGTRISGGERQRIAVARAFLKRSPILILDEPTSSIDSRTESVILEALERLAEGRTTLMIAHRLSTVRMADRIVVVDDGRVVDQGTHEALVGRGGLYASLWAAQTGQGAAPAGRPPTSAPPAAVPPQVPAVTLATAGAGPALRTRPKVVVLGMMSTMPVAGVVWQTMHYLVGLERLGIETYYVETHARTPTMLMTAPGDDATGRAVPFIADVMHRFGFDGRWAFHARHDDGAVYGMSRERLDRLYGEADLIVNLHGGTEPLPELTLTGRLVYLETDPVRLQIELAEGRQETMDFLEPHSLFFTFAENYGNPDCGLPATDHFRFLPTRQPVVCDFWEPYGLGGRADVFATVGNWRQQWRDVTFRGETYHWTKHLEFEKFMDLPRHTTQPLELALSTFTDDDRTGLESSGWRVANALEFSFDVDRYRRYVAAARGEFTVAKDQNVRLRSGWFSDRSATFLAAGRPVVTQDTGFGNVLPTGAGLYAFSTLDDIVDALDAINGDYERHRRAARQIARGWFGHDVVLRPILAAAGIPVVGRTTVTVEAPTALAADVDLTVVSRHPTTLAPATVAAVLGAPVPAVPIAADQPAVSIVVVTHDNLVFSRMCLESVLANTGRTDVEIVVVDNASTDLTPAYLERLGALSPQVRCLYNPDNVGFAAAVNAGIRASRGALVVLLNNDTVVAPGWIDRLERHLADPTVGMVGPLTNAAPNEARIDVSYSTYGGLLEQASARAIACDGEAFDIDVLTMFCVALRREVYDRIGDLDERFEVGMFEDDDYALRLRAAGLRLRCAEDVLVHHFGEASFGALVATGEHHRIFEANRRRFEEKWATSWNGHQRRHSDEYERLVSMVREAITAAVPEGETVLVVNKGDEGLLDVDGRAAWHFPQQDDGAFAGWYPATTGEVLEHLGRLAGRGARYVVFPETASWWFDFYDGLEDELALDFDEVDVDAGCRIFARREPATEGAAR